MSWAEYEIISDIEEERIQEHQAKLKAIEDEKRRAIQLHENKVNAEKRQALLTKGLYDLEDGEILE